MAQTAELTPAVGGDGDKIHHDLPVAFDDGDGGGIVPESEDVLRTRVKHAFHLEGYGGREATLPALLGKSGLQLSLERDQRVEDAKRRALGSILIEESGFNPYKHYY